MRFVKTLVLLVLTLFIFNSEKVSAKNVDITIEDIKVVSNSNTVEVTKPTIKDNKISSEITFNDVNDYVTFEVSLKNNDSSKYSIEKISDNNKNSNIKITYDYDDKEIKGNGSKKITIKFTYEKKVEQGDVLSLDDVKIILDLVKENGDSAKVIINNPKTSDVIVTYAIIFVISSALIARNITRRELKKILPLFVITLLVIPRLISATTDEKYEINISFNNAHINGNSLTYSINIDEELINQADKSYKILFDGNGGTGSLDSLEYKYNDRFNLPENPYIKYGHKFLGWNTKSDGTGKNYDANELVSALTDKDEITLYANWEDRTSGTTYKGTNKFGGQNTLVKGDASNNQKIDYLNTGIKPFTSENREKDFVLSFKLSEIDPSRAKDKEALDTLFTIVANASDISTENPGVTLRLRDGRWVFETGNGIEKLTRVLIPFNNLINKEFKLIRISNGSSIKLYYSIDGENPIFLKDLTKMAPNDASISFGATYYDENTGRYLNGNIDDISFKYYDSLGLSELFNETYDDEFPVLFTAKGPCTFNGEENNITGTSCETYSNDKYINSNISLFSEENYKKDFEISFDIISYNPDNQDSSNIQQTFMNIKLEDQSVDYPGIVVRKNYGNIYIGAKDGTGAVNQYNIKYTEVDNVRIIKKSNIVYYSINGKNFTKLFDMSNFDHVFDVPLYFGSSSLPDGTPMRIMNATLSNMTIRMGKINQDIK